MFIDLNSGRSVYVNRLHQWRTYEGLLEGWPTREMNTRKIENAVKHAQNSFSKATHLVEPTETLLEWTGDKPYPFGTPAKLPAVHGEIWLQSWQPTRNPDFDTSWLVVVFFQDEFALPFAPNVLEQLKALDWDSLAHEDYE